VKLIAISARAVRQFPVVAQALLQELLDSDADRMVVIDYAAVKRRRDLHAPTAPMAAHRIDLARWLRQDTDTYLPDQEAIRQSTAELSANRPIMVDASGYQAASVIPVLEECRVAWFELDRWHPGFILLCNDVALPHASEALFDTFYVRPRLLTRTEAIRLAKGVRLRAMLAFWFGFRSSAHKRLVAWLLGWLEGQGIRGETRDLKQIRRWTPD
jgi:hypothetical protein